ncbi:transcription elongation factor GreA [Endomicrobium proavitum]|uniref:Transcription elongation factor GreA n=1 Tax=Endomicrobium proavitum TaxID=1408281 RepID=A0A0G3WIF7_9BACT|nr:transcription elongation factor GreA [Endomicrobium proavitum]AKL97657.1 Transcription elongation factor GreA [Endomicrobium proavitum]
MAIYLTKAGKEKLWAELDALQKRKPLVQEEIARAREHGDLKENAEYHAAKETLTNIMRRIEELDTKINSAKILEDLDIEPDKVFIGVTVNLQDEDGDDYEYMIVDLEEANPAENKISVQSPLVQGLLGHKTGETVEVELPARKAKFKILKITR